MLDGDAMTDAELQQARARAQRLLTEPWRGQWDVECAEDSLRLLDEIDRYRELEDRYADVTAKRAALVAERGRLLDILSSIAIPTDEPDPLVARVKALRETAERVAVLYAAEQEETRRMRAVLPRADELDSVMSLLNWTREHHDRDSSARQWLERVVETALAKEKP